MTNKVSLYIPSTIQVSRQADNTDMVERAAYFFSNMFGGATITEASGAWVSASEGLIREDITIVSAFAESLSAAELNKIEQFALQVKEEMLQEALAVEINGRLHLL